MSCPVADAHPDTHTDAHTDAHTDRIIYPDAERVTDKGAHMDRIPNDLIIPVFRAADAWWHTIDNSDDERDAERDLICACRDLLAYVDGEQRVCSHQREPEPDPDSEFGFVDNIIRSYRLGWDTGVAAAKHRSR